MKHRRQRHFNPAHIAPGASCVLDARFIPGQANASALATWPSRSNASITATQGTSGSRPVYYDSTLNGMPGVVFDGADDFMSLSSGALSISANTNSVWSVVVGVCTSIVDALQIGLFISRGTNNTTNRFSTRLSDTSVQRGSCTFRRLDNDTNKVTGSAGSTSSPVILICGSDYVNNSVTAALNGGSPGTGTYSSGGGSGPTSDSLAAAIGAISASSSRLNGKLSLVVIFNAIPSASVIKRIRNAASYAFKIKSS